VRGGRVTTIEHFERGFVAALNADEQRCVVDFRDRARRHIQFNEPKSSTDHFVLQLIQATR